MAQGTEELEKVNIRLFKVDVDAARRRAEKDHRGHHAVIREALRRGLKRRKRDLRAWRFSISGGNHFTGEQIESVLGSDGHSYTGPLVVVVAAESLGEARDLVRTDAETRGEATGWIDAVTPTEIEIDEPKILGLFKRW